jgi:hypothetical protein
MLQKPFIVVMLVIVGAILLSNILIGAFRRFFGKKNH